MIIQKLTKAGALVAGALLACQAAHAAGITANDLYMGFQNSGASSDYIVNLGAASSILGQDTVVNLSGDFTESDITAILGGAGTSYAGTIGANNAGGVPSVANPADAYGTVLRTSNLGNNAVSGSVQPTAISSGSDITAYNDLGTLNAPATAGGQLDSGKTFTADVPSSGATAGTYNSATGLIPNSAVTTSSALIEDLWYTADPSTGRTDTSKPWVYEGYFTIDLTGSSPDVTFTSDLVTAVPEPTTYGLMAGAGLLLLSLRRQLGVKLA